MMSFYVGAMYDRYLTGKNIECHTKKYSQLTEQKKLKKVEKLVEARELSQKDRFGLLLKHLEVSEKEEKKLN